MKSSGSDVFYRTTSDKTILQAVDKDIALILGKQKGTPSTFNASSAIIITFDNIQSLGLSSVLFKYQTVIATDFKNTFAIVDYERLDGDGIEIGFYEVYCKHLKRFTGSSESKQLVDDTNVGIPGKQVHLLTNNDNRCSNPEGTFISVFYFLYIFPSRHTTLQ